jgi:hypothetical protein
MPDCIHPRNIQEDIGGHNIDLFEITRIMSPEYAGIMSLKYARHDQMRK